MEDARRVRSRLHVALTGAVALVLLAGCTDQVSREDAQPEGDSVRATSGFPPETFSTHASSSRAAPERTPVEATSDATPPPGLPPAWYALLDTNTAITWQNIWALEDAPIQSQMWFLLKYAGQGTPMSEESYACLSNLVMKSVREASDPSNVGSMLMNMGQVLLWRGVTAERYWHLYETAQSAFDRFDPDAVADEKHETVTQIIRACLYVDGTEQEKPVAVPLILDYIARLDNSDVPLRYKVEADHDYVSGIMIHGPPEQGIAAIDALLSKYTPEELELVNTDEVAYLQGWRERLVAKSTNAVAR